MRQGEWSGEGEKPRTVWAGVGAGAGTTWGALCSKRRPPPRDSDKAASPGPTWGGVAAPAPPAPLGGPGIPAHPQHTPNPHWLSPPFWVSPGVSKASTAAGAQTQHGCRAPQATALSRQHLGLGWAWAPTSLLSGPPLRPLPGVLLGVRPALPSLACSALPAPSAWAQPSCLAGRDGTGEVRLAGGSCAHTCHLPPQACPRGKHPPGPAACTRQPVCPAPGPGLAAAAGRRPGECPRGLLLLVPHGARHWGQ